jgi:RNA polymerase sigma factor (sigma-70 family)
MDDLDLLSQYSRQGSQAAFSALVGRHIDMVYSAARRQVWSDELAEEITQAVFLDLARHAEKLRPDSHLGSWLYVVARRTSVDAIRRESRRQKREQAAAEGAALNTAPSPWSKVAPVLDDAISSLRETDRKAILLRFFEKKSFSEIGRSLGASEEAAQKRVGRAVDRLRISLAHRGVPTTAALLTAEFIPHAVQAAPNGLSGTISSLIPSVSSTAQSAALLKSTQLLAMTFAQKTAVVTLLAAAVVGGLLQNNRIHVQSHEIANLQKQGASWQQQIAQLNRERTATAQVASARQESESRPAKKSSIVAPAASTAFADDFVKQRQLQLAKAAQMKPLLAAGTPIKGGIVVIRNGKAVDESVEFAIGKETRIKSDDGTYTVTPALNDDGSVKYNFVRSSGAERISVNVTAFPWTEFQFEGTEDGSVLAFVPDEKGPIASPSHIAH